MDHSQRADVLELLKALADENRLTMIGLMHDRERTVTEMAGLLSLSEPTISHHVSKLHAVGLLHLRMQGNQRFYRINPRRLDTFKSYAARIEALPEKPTETPSDNAWIDALPWSDADKKILREYTVNGRLIQLPSKLSKWEVILRWLASKFQPNVRYTEKQVNAVLSEAHADYATLRRYLIDFGYMRRQRGGEDYWLAPEDEAPTQSA